MLSLRSSLLWWAGKKKKKSLQLSQMFAMHPVARGPFRHVDALL